MPRSLEIVFKFICPKAGGSELILRVCLLQRLFEEMRARVSTLSEPSLQAHPSHSISKIYIYFFDDDDDDSFNAQSFTARRSKLLWSQSITLYVMMNFRNLLHMHVAYLVLF